MGVKLLEDPNLTLQHLQLSQWEAYCLAQDHSFTDSIQALLKQFENEHCNQLLSKTSLMIKPGYRIRSVAAILTNFHQPKSTLLLLIHAFIGKNWKHVYEHALANEYRFLSYGDGSLLWLNS
jgi:S-adenosylmethionine:tRNA ribosyltransferase-isomerase